MMGKGKRSLDSSEKRVRRTNPWHRFSWCSPSWSDRAYGSQLRRFGAYLRAEFSDCLWAVVPHAIALWWLRRRVTSIRKAATALREALAIHRSAVDRRSEEGKRLLARWVALEADCDAVERRLEHLEQRARKPPLERKQRIVLFAYLLLGIAFSYLGWVADVLAARGFHGLPGLGD